MRAEGFDYSKEGAYFITICAGQRGLPFGDVGQLSQLGSLVNEEWRNLPSHFTAIELDAFVVMPDHLHGIVLLSGGVQLSLVIGGFKSGVSRLWGAPVWQRSYFDRVLRNSRELDLARRYIEENPQRWLDR